MLLTKLFLVPGFIAIIAIIGRTWGASIAGLLSGLPVIAGPIIGFIYLEQGVDFAQQAATGTISGIVALSSFCFFYSWISTRLKWKLTFLFSLLIYLVIAFLIGNMDFSLHESTLLALITILVQLYFSPHTENTILLSPASNTEILCRMLFAFMLVIAVTHFAEALGEAYSGIFAAFPIAGSTIALFSHRNFSAFHAIKSLKSMKQGLLSMLIFFYLITALSDKINFSSLIIIAAAAALLLQAIVIYLRKIYYSRDKTSNKGYKN